ALPRQPFHDRLKARRVKLPDAVQQPVEKTRFACHKWELNLPNSAHEANNRIASLTASPSADIPRPARSQKAPDAQNCSPTSRADGPCKPAGRPFARRNWVPTHPEGFAC